MQRTTTIRGGLLLATVLIVGAVAAYYATRSNGASSGRQTHVVMTAKNGAVGKTILVDRNGMTLYSLSVERRGRFICTNAACLAIWKPLVVRGGVTPTGARGLSVVKRPDGSRQVAFRGGPLYRFTGDHKRGDVNGNGFKDVGTWSVVSVGKHASSAPAPAPAGRYGY